MMNNTDKKERLLFTLPFVLSGLIAVVVATALALLRWGP